MKVFHCDHCQQLVFFENTVCVSCGQTLAYLPDLEDMGSLDPVGEGRWRSPLAARKAGSIAFATITRSKMCATGWFPTTIRILFARHAV